MMKMLGIRPVVFAAAVLVAALAPVAAQEWPTRNVTVVVPIPAGVASDIIARVVFEQVGKQVGQSFVIENRTGAGGTIGANIVFAARKEMVESNPKLMEAFYAAMTDAAAWFHDPKNFDDKSFVDFRGDWCIIPPNSFALARTVEYFRIPRNVLTICLGKSTYARCGIIVNVTPFEPEWEGFVTLEFSNTTPLPAKIYANEGIAQVIFFESDEVCETSYKDRGGKYQGQQGVTLPKI